jgi:hypothetical protein
MRIEAHLVVCAAHIVMIASGGLACNRQSGQAENERGPVTVQTAVATTPTPAVIAVPADTAEMPTPSVPIVAATFGNTHICPAAAERAIQRMSACGLDTEGFTPAMLCTTMSYSKLSFIGSRSCAEIGAMLEGQ